MPVFMGRGVTDDAVGAVQRSSQDRSCPGVSAPQVPTGWADAH